MRIPNETVERVLQSPQGTSEGQLFGLLDPKAVRRQRAPEAVNNAVVTGVTQHGDDFVIAVKKDLHAEKIGGG